MVDVIAESKQKYLNINRICEVIERRYTGNRDTPTIVQMQKMDNIFRQKCPFQILYANGMCEMDCV